MVLGQEQVVITGQLEIQMWANLAKLQADMNDAKGMVESSMKDISLAVDVAKAAFIAFAGVSSARAFRDMVLGAVDAAGALNDLAIQTGATVGSLSAMQEIGRTSNTSIETIAGAVNKMGKGMAGATEDSKGVSQAIKALGINFDDFRKMKPDDQMVAVSKAMNQFEDGAGKSAIAMTLWGREGAKMLPFTKDLAEAGKLQAVVTEQQAAQADNFGDNLTKLQAAGGAWKRELSLGMLPAMDEALTAFLDVTGGTNGLKSKIKELAADGSIAEWTRMVITGATYVMDIFAGVGRVFKSIGEIAGGVGALIGDSFQTAGSIVMKVLKGDFAGALADNEAAGKRQKVIWGELGTTLDKVWSEQTLGQQLRGRMEDIKATGTVAAAIKPKLDFSPVSEGNAKADRAAATELRALQKEQEKQADLIAKLSGLTGSFTEDWNRLNGMFRTGKLTTEQLTTAQAELLAKQPAMIAHAKEQAEAMKTAEKAAADLAKEYDQYTGALFKTADSLEQQVDRQLAENAAIGKTTGQLELLGIERLNEQIRVAQAAVDADALTNECNKETVAHEQTLDALLRLAGGRSAGVHLKMAQEANAEWQKTADGIYTGVTGAILNGTSVGKTLFADLKNYAVDTFAKTVLQPLVKDVLTPFLDIWKGVVNYISKDVIQPIVKNVWETFKGWFQGVLSWITGDSSSVITPQLSTSSLSGWLDLFKAGVSKVLDWFGSSWSGVFSSLSTGWEAIFGSGSGGWLSDIGNLASAASGSGQPAAGGGVVSNLATGGGIIGAGVNIYNGLTAGTGTGLLGGAANWVGNLFGPSAATTAAAAASSSAAATAAGTGLEGLSAEALAYFYGDTAAAAAAAASTSTAATSAAGAGASGASSALAAAGPFAAFAAAFMVLSSYMDKQAGTPIQGFYSNDPNLQDGIDKEGWAKWEGPVLQLAGMDAPIDNPVGKPSGSPFFTTDRAQPNDALAQSLLSTVTDQYTALTKALGGAAEALTGSVYLMANPTGKGEQANSILQFDAKLNGQTVYSRDGGRTGDGLLAGLSSNDPAVLQAAIEQSASQAVLRALQETNFSNEINKQLDAINVAGSVAEIQAQLAAVTASVQQAPVVPTAAPAASAGSTSSLSTMQATGEQQANLLQALLLEIKSLAEDQRIGDSANAAASNRLANLIDRLTEGGNELRTVVVAGP